MEGRIPAPDCLGKIPQSYSDWCSAGCRLTALCVLIAMGDYLRQNDRVPPWREFTDGT
jgi:hypothetical protein